MNHPALRSGIDLVEIQRIETLNPAVRHRFLCRVFTANELAEAGSSWSSIAGKFAAKEAVSKALGCGIGPVSWQDMEILRGENGQPVLSLHRAAQKIAQQQGLLTWSISISHSRVQAVAVAVAFGLNEPYPIFQEKAA